MDYIDLTFYQKLYGNIDATLFNRLAFDACREIDKNTTGIDGVKKLRVAFPTEPEDKEAVMRCAANLVSYFARIESAEQAAEMSRGYESTEQGLRRKIVSRIEAGNEAISYSEASSPETVSDKAAASHAERGALVASVIRQYLSGVSDANGVNLLYMGPYPVRYR